MKMMMIEAPETCADCCCNDKKPYKGFSMCYRVGLVVNDSTRPQWCIDKDVEVPDEK